MEIYDNIAISSRIRLARNVDGLKFYTKLQSDIDAKYITNSRHLILTSPHPSPFSARYGFFGSKPFSKTNEFLRKNGLKEIDWRIEK